MINEINEFVAYLNNTHGNDSRSFDFIEGKVYYKITTYTNNTSVYAFIPKADIDNKSIGKASKGSLLKPAGWNAPAKHARGNVFDKDTWNNAGVYSLAYLK